MTKDTIIVTNNNVSPADHIAVVCVDTRVQPNTESTTDLDYDSFTAAEKTLHDAYVAMIKSKI